MNDNNNIVDPNAPLDPNDPNKKKGMSTGQKVAVGGAVALGIGAVAAVGIGAAAVGAGALGAGAYAVHQSHEAKKQNASPLRLHLRCISASNLIAADWGGKSDPYVETKVGYVALRSTVKKKTLDPIWNEDLEMGIYDKHLQKNLKLEVFDKDTISDDSLGIAKLSFAEIPYNYPKEFNLQLKNKKKKGTLRVALWLTQTAIMNQGPQQGFNQGVNAAPQQPYMSQPYMQQPYMGQPMQQPYMGQPMQQPYMGQPMQQPYMGQPMQQPYMSQPMQQPYMGQQYVSQQQFQPQNPYNSQFPQQGYPPQ